MNIWLYVFLFAILGIPLVGYLVRNLVKLGVKVYDKYPIVRKFFDDYAEHYGIGLIITVVAGVVYGVLRWFGVV